MSTIDQQYTSFNLGVLRSYYVCERVTDIVIPLELRDFLWPPRNNSKLFDFRPQHHTAQSSTATMANLKPTSSSDTDTLALLGKKQVLKRRFGFWSLFGFAVCELITWETVLALFSQGFNNGGPAGLVYGFILAWSSTLSVYTVISELASLAPIAGGQYYWVYMLAPPEWKVFCSYIIGWLTSLAWVATVATETIFAGTMLQGLAILDHPNYDAKLWQGTFLAWGVLLTCVLVNVIIPGFLPRFEVFIIVFHISGFIAIVAVLWTYAPHGSSHFVWATAFNEGGWPTQGLSYCVGFLGNVATFVGADASVHLAEEVANAARNIPRAIICSMCLNGLVGFIMMITTLYCLGDVTSVLDTDTGTFPLLKIYWAVYTVPACQKPFLQSIT